MSPSDVSVTEFAAQPAAAPVVREKTGPCGIATSDLEACKAAIRTGSYSFHAASRLMPARYRDPCLALYAFCRLADDAVDLHDEKAAAVLRLGERLEAVYAGRPENAAADRAFAAVVEAVDMPRALPEALIEGLAWDAMERRYDSLSDLRAYSARVASAVGVMMSVIMGVRDPHALARACDIGVAMQLTNIARDVGEDARAERIYLPQDWMQAANLPAALFLTDPVPTEPVRNMVKRLLAEARRLYIRGTAGIAALPAGCRPGIYAARHIYAGIGTEIARAGYDSVSRRAHTSTTQKLGWLARATAEAGASRVMPRAAVIYAQPLEECRFLVEAAAPQVGKAGQWGSGRSGTLVAAFAALRAQDARRRTARGQALAAE